MVISFIIATYNRAQLLKETIENLFELFNNEISTGEIELVIIDNNSKDNTQSIINNLYQRYKNIKYFIELNQGLSHARNRGIKEAVGDLLVFIDDDVELKSDYITICKKLFSDININIVGGKVLPFKTNIPNWLPPKYDYLASVLDLGDEHKQVTKVMGANFMLRRKVAQEVGWYDPALGRKGDMLMGGEEEDYLTRAQQMGYTILYSPELVVYHKINNKLNKEYILNYAFLQGRSESIMDSKTSRFKVLVKSIKSVLAIVLYNVYGRHISNAQRQTFFEIINAFGNGYLRGAEKAQLA